MYFHWQNLNEKKHGKKGWGIFYGRAWWRITDRVQIDWCWCARPKLEVETFIESGGMVSGDRHVTLHVCFFGLSFFLSLTHPWLDRLWRWASKRDGWRAGIGLRWDRTLQANIDVATREMSHRSKDPRWIRGFRFDFADIIFGSHAYSREVLARREVVIPMPEGSYPATVELDVCRWKRPRWPRAMVRYGSQVDIPKGIPFAGKGENSWDCGDDGLYGINPAAETVEDAIGATVVSVLKSRRQNGQASFLQGKSPVMADAAPSSAG